MDNERRLAELDQQITDIDRQQYAMAKSTAPRDDAYKAKAAALSARYRELSEQEKALRN